MGDVGQGAHPSQTGGQGLDFAVQAIQPADMLAHPVLGDQAIARGEVAEQVARQPQVVLEGSLAEVGRLARLPKAKQAGASAGPADDVLVGRQLAHDSFVEGFLRGLETGARRGFGQGAQQAGQVGKVEVAVAPKRRLHRVEAVGFDRGDQIGVHGFGAGGDAEGAVSLEPASPARDLAHFVGMQVTASLAVELGQTGESHMVDVHVEAHADGVGGHQEVHFTGLEQGHLGVAGARAERAHHHRRPASLAADELGDGVDLLGGEGDDGAAPRQATDLARPGPGQGGVAIAGDDPGLGQEPAHEWGHGRCAEQHGLAPPARVKQALGEDMPALGIGGELHLVDGQELHVAPERHSLHRAHEIGRPGGNDLLFAGDQGHAAHAPGGRHSIVDLPGQKAQRQADHAGGVAQHTLHRQVGLAGVGGAEDGDDLGRDRGVKRQG